MAQRRAAMPSLTLRALRTAAAAAAAMGAVTKMGRKADGKGKVIFGFRNYDFNMICVGFGGFYPSHLLPCKDRLLQ